MTPTTPASFAAQTRPTLLVVDDSAATRERMCRLLAGEGYRVLVAADGHEALWQAGRHRGSIDLLVTDVDMPRMNGQELARRLRAHRPEMDVLYAANPVSVPLGMRLSPSFLAKPFRPADLLERVARLTGSAVSEGAAA